MRLMTVEEVASRLSVPTSTLRQWIREGKAPQSTRIGKRRLFRESDVAQWIESQFSPGKEIAHG